jgi:hypothetical protein
MAANKFLIIQAIDDIFYGKRNEKCFLTTLLSKGSKSTPFFLPPTSLMN